MDIDDELQTILEANDAIDNQDYLREILKMGKRCDFEFTNEESKKIWSLYKTLRKRFDPFWYCRMTEQAKSLENSDKNLRG